MTDWLTWVVSSTFWVKDTKEGDGTNWDDGRVENHR
jgi:hypothetical protein